MTLYLSEIDFSYDFFSTPLPNGNTLIINKIDEDFLAENKETVINALNLIVALEDGSANVLCSSVIGTENDYFTVASSYTEYLGKVLTTENMKYCTLEINENE